MTALVQLVDGSLVISNASESIAGRHRSQLAYWGFAADGDKLYATPEDVHLTLDKLVGYLSRHGIPHSLSEEVAESRAALVHLRADLGDAVERGRALKEGALSADVSGGFLEFVARSIPRRLKEHQLKAALHLLSVTNGANFSVPGSGKTTVVLAVHAWLKSIGIVDSLFVVGPPACFGPWKVEYEAVLGVRPKAVILAGGDAEDRHVAYAAHRGEMADLYLTSFQTLQRDFPRARSLFTDNQARIFLVVDEAHYIKQVGGAWASAVLAVAPSAARRCVLTGTPFPRTFSDSFNLFDTLWPRTSPLPQADRIRIEHLAQKQRNDEATEVLAAAIGPLFYRVRKSDLHLAPQEFHPPIIAEMRTHEKRIYDSILDRVRSLSMDDYLRDIDLLVRLRRGRMMRVRQTVSYAKLLGTAVLDYSEDLSDGDLSLTDVIRHYDELETPGKISALISLLDRLRNSGERKVVVWSHFVGALKNIERHLTAEGYGVALLYGDTPVESTPLSDVLTREEIIDRFLAPESGLDILIANPAACAESISLHKTCSHAVYYDLSYNCAQYLQSLDRIHRVGGSEEKISHYHFIQYADTVDQDLLTNVREKAARMSAIIDREYPVYSLDMFGEDEELEAYARLFR